MSKDFGPVSGYLDPAARSWEQVTWLTGKAPLEREFNLQGELFLRRLLREVELPSGFLMGRDLFGPGVFPLTNDDDYLNEPGQFRNRLPALPAVPNTLYFGPGQVAHVSGMPLFLRTASTEWIPVDLPTAPAGVAAKRFDFVYLEVWRAGLTGDVAADITRLVRDAAGKIFYNGWVDSPTADNHLDDVFDAGSGTTTSQRVQVQWRIRVVGDVALNTYPDGLDDPSVFAQGPEAAVTTSPFANLGGTGDAGLWVSTGPHSNTVDGVVFGIPICAVARRNTSTWDKGTNQNGGVGIRPDGYTHDLIQEGDIIDLRKAISRDWNFEELLQKNMSWLLDGKLRTYFQDTGLGGGEVATTYTQADEIGPVDTPGATLIDAFDGYKKQFSDATVSNFHFQQVTLASRTSFTSATEWMEGDTFDISLPVSSEGILELVLEGGIRSGYSVTTQHYNVSGLNTQTLSFTLRSPFEADIPLGSRTSVELYFRVAASWPGGRGLSRDPLDFQAGVVAGAVLGTLEVGDSFVWETAVPAGVTALDTASNFYKPSRTATLLANTTRTSVSIGSRTTSTTVVPFDVRSVTGIFDAVLDPGKTTNLFIGITGDNTIVHAVVPATHRSMLVDLVSKDPIGLGEQVTLYYKSRAAQTLNVSAGGLNVTDAKIHIVHAPRTLYAATAGSGSHAPGFPYVSPNSAFPISIADPTLGEHIFDLKQTMNIDDFGSDAHLMELMVHVPLAHIPFFDFTNRGVDGEGRYFFNDVQTTTYDDTISGTPVPYQPAVFAKLLLNEHYHKVMYSCIGMCMEDSNLGKRGTLLLVVFTRTTQDAQNAVIFDSAAGGDSCVAIYRLKGNPTLATRKRQLGHPLIEV